MGYARVRSVGLLGLEGHPVVVEAHVDAGLPALVLSGLPDASLNEARDRVRAAIVNSDETWPQRRVTVNLLPADLPKRGSGFDLAIAIVAARRRRRLPAARTRRRRRHRRARARRHGSARCAGVLPMVLAAARAGIGRLDRAGRQRGRGRPGARASWCGRPRPCGRSSTSYAGRRRCPSRRRPSTAADEPAPDLADVVGQDRGRLRARAGRGRPAPPRAVRAAGRRQDDARAAPADRSCRRWTTRPRWRSPRCTRSPARCRRCRA